MKIQLPSARHLLLLLDRGTVDLHDRVKFWPSFASFPAAAPWDGRRMLEVFDLIRVVHGDAARASAMSIPIVDALCVWPGHMFATALLRVRFGIPEIAWVSVLEGWRGRGIAGRMVEELVHRCTSRYVCAVTSNPSVVPFWEKCGFHVAEEIPEDK